MLSFMAMDYFAKSPVLSMPLLALGLFLSAFITIAVRTALTDKRAIDSLAHLPLDDGEPAPTDTRSTRRALPGAEAPGTADSGPRADTDADTQEKQP